MPSDITTRLRPDRRVSLSSNYQLGATDRRVIDDQIIGVQTHLAEGVIRGQQRSYFMLDASSVSLAVGDVFCVSPSATVDESDAATAVRVVTRATDDALASAGMIVGIAATSAAPGAMFAGIVDGIVGPGITGLVAGNKGAVRVNSARCERVASFSGSDYAVGFVDDAGNLTISKNAAGAAVGGGATLSDDSPAALAVAADPGADTKASRADHVHPQTYVNNTLPGVVQALQSGKGCFTPTCGAVQGTYDGHTWSRREVNVASYLPLTSDFADAVHAARDHLQTLNAADAGVAFSLGKRGGRIIFPQGDYVTNKRIDFEGWTGLELHGVGGSGYTCQTRIIWSTVPTGHTTTGTSTSSKTIAGSGSITFNVGTGLYIRPGDTITFTETGNTASVTGVVPVGGYSGSNVTLTITGSTGSGTFSNWTWSTRNKDYLLSFRSTLTCSMQGIAIIKPPSAAGFIGNAVDGGHGTTGSDAYQFSARRCAIFGWDATEDTSVGFYLGGSTSFIIEQCLGLYGGYGVRASNGPGLISNCFFGEYQQWAMEVGGFTMAVLDCTFEPRNYGPKTGQQCGVFVRTSSPNVTIARCYFGDSTATSGYWIKTGATCTNIENCFFNGGVGSYCVHGYGNILNFTGNSLQGGTQRVFTDATGTIGHLFCAGNYSTATLTALSTLPFVTNFTSFDFGNLELSTAKVVSLFVEASLTGTPGATTFQNGLNPNISPSKFNMAIQGPTLPFSWDGLAHPGPNGQFLWFEYRGSQQFTIKHLSGSAVGAQIRTPTGQDIVFPGNAGGSVVRGLLCFIDDAWVLMHVPTRASHILNDSSATGTTVKDALNALNSRKVLDIHWASANDNSAASGVPIIFGNCKSNANDSLANKVFASISLPAGSIVSDMRVMFLNANAEHDPIFELLHFSDDAATTLSCTVTTGTRNAVDTAHTYTVPNDSGGYGKIYCKKSTASGLAESGNYHAIIMARVTLP